MSSTARGRSGEPSASEIGGEPVDQPQQPTNDPASREECHDERWSEAEQEHEYLCHALWRRKALVWTERQVEGAPNDVEQTAPRRRSSEKDHYADRHDDEYSLPTRGRASGAVASGHAK